jgi:predicted O-methyltransferase YrrM
MVATTTGRRRTGATACATSSPRPHSCLPFSSGLSPRGKCSRSGPRNAARDVAASLVSVEIDTERSAQAAANLAAAGLDQFVELRVEDAALTLAEAPAEAHDLILLDAERDAYATYWPDIARTLSPRGLLAVDNAISHASDLVAFMDLISSDDRFIHALCPSGAGLLLLTRASSR